MINNLKNDIAQWSDLEQTENALNKLIDEFAIWSKANGFAKGDCMELMHEDDLNEDQTEWLADFYYRWEAA
tara:strand:+ start:1894 stop:2106 length:213 start_codon:yes stop_codon:yes gene_type:complete